MHKYKILGKDNVQFENIAQLYALVWPSEEFEKILTKTKWAFNHPQSKIILFQDDKKLIAVRGAFEWPLILDNKYIKTYQLHGTCVHSDYRRKGIFTKINKIFLDEAGKNGFQLIFNVSVKSSRIGYEKLGWLYLNGFRRLTFINNPIAFFQKKLLKDKYKYDTEKDTGTNESSYSDVPELLFKERDEQFKGLIHTKYSNEFLKWRLKNQNENYKLLMYKSSLIIYKIKSSDGIKELIIGDLFLMSKKYNSFKTLIEQIIKKENPDITYTYIFNTHPYYWYYLRYMFLLNPLNYNLNFGTRTLDKTLITQMAGKKWGMSFLDIDTF